MLSGAIGFLTVVVCAAGGSDGSATGVGQPPAPLSESASNAQADAWTVQRVGGDMDLRVQRTKEGFACDGLEIDTPLPEGYPDPTPPGAIDLKKYPEVRRAEVSGDGSSQRGQNRGFWPLFRHIQRRDIAMTAPVEMELRDWDGASAPTGWTMAFLYRTADLGPTGNDGDVVVRDAAPVTVVSIGVRGSYTQTRFDAALRRLEEWIAANPQWERAGEARWLGYNNPRWFSDEWSEVQIPITAVPAEAEASDASDAGS